MEDDILRIPPVDALLDDVGDQLAARNRRRFFSRGSVGLGGEVIVGGRITRRGAAISGRGTTGLTPRTGRWRRTCSRGRPGLRPCHCTGSQTCSCPPTDGRPPPGDPPPHDHFAPQTYRPSTKKTTSISGCKLVAHVIQQCVYRRNSQNVVFHRIDFFVVRGYVVFGEDFFRVIMVLLCIVICERSDRS